MTNQAKRKPPEQDCDYDGAGKEALRLYLPLFLLKYPKLDEVPARSTGPGTDRGCADGA